MHGRGTTPMSRPVPRHHPRLWTTDALMPAFSTELSFDRPRKNVESTFRHKDIHCSKNEQSKDFPFKTMTCEALTKQCLSYEQSYPVFVGRNGAVADLLRIPVTWGAPGIASAGLVRGARRLIGAPIPSGVTRIRWRGVWGPRQRCSTGTARVMSAKASRADERTLRQAARFGAFDRSARARALRLGPASRRGRIGCFFVAESRPLPIFYFFYSN